MITINKFARFFLIFFLFDCNFSFNIAAEKSNANNNDSKIFFDFFSIFFTTTTTAKSPAQIIYTEVSLEICNPYQCGIPNIISTKIMNGTTARPNYYPWTVYLTYKGLFYTGAVVISNKYILTAAHSGNIENLRALRVIFLDYNRDFSSRSEISFTRKITKIITHRKYGQGSQYDSDIALMKLERHLIFPDEFLRPICLPKSDENSYAGQIGTILGWGSTSENGNFSKELQEAPVNIWSNEECVRKSEYGSGISENMICAGYLEGVIDACKGDSGGPLQILDENNLYTLIGLVSWGRGCAEPRKPGVYTRVTKYLKWIRENTKDAC